MYSSASFSRVSKDTRGLFRPCSVPNLNLPLARELTRRNSMVSDTSLRQPPLSGIRILDLSRVLAGPWATQILGDLGAEVIKVETPGKGDDTRQWGPPYMKDSSGQPTKESSYFLSANRNKKSICVDFSKPSGQDLLRALASKSDVLVENFKVGALSRYRLDYDSISKTGPRRSEPGYDFMIQGMGGLMSITGEETPMKVGVAVTDMMTGMYALNGIMAALYHRDRPGLGSGQGQHVDISLFDTQLAYIGYRAQDFIDSGKVPARLGNAHPNIVPYNSFPTADGHIIIAVGNDGQFRSLCQVMERPDVGSDERFSTNPLRVKHRDLLTSILSDIFKLKSTSDWIRLLEVKGDIPHSPIRSVDQVLQDKQVVSRQMIVKVPHPLKPEGAQLIANPLKFSDTPIRYDRAPPLLGQDTSLILADLLGTTGEELERLRKDGVIQ